MAEIIAYPDATDFSSSVFTYPSGTVTIDVPEGEFLSVERANFLLDQVKYELMKAMMRGTDG